VIGSARRCCGRGGRRARPLRLVDHDHLHAHAVSQLLAGQVSGAAGSQDVGLAQAAQLPGLLGGGAVVEEGVGVQDDSEVVHPPHPHPHPHPRQPARLDRDVVGEP